MERKGARVKACVGNWQAEALKKVILETTTVSILESPVCMCHLNCCRFVFYTIEFTVSFFISMYKGVLSRVPKILPKHLCMEESKESYRDLSIPAWLLLRAS